MQEVSSEKPLSWGFYQKTTVMGFPAAPSAQAGAGELLTLAGSLSKLDSERLKILTLAHHVCTTQQPGPWPALAAWCSSLSETIVSRLAAGSHRHIWR